MTVYLVKSKTTVSEDGNIGSKILIMEQRTHRHTHFKKLAANKKQVTESKME